MVVYFRFLYIAVVSFMALTNVKLASISWSSSSVLCDTFVIHSLFSVRNRACSRLMYMSVVFECLCPKMY
jgi:hypothetical protein